MHLRKNRKSAIVALSLVGVFLLFGMLAFSQAYDSAQEVKKLKESGTLVTATVTEIVYDSDDHDYNTRYLYTDEQGRQYTGSTGKSYGSKQSAEEHIGEEIAIYIGADGDSVRADFPLQTKYFQTMYYVLWSVFGAIVAAIVVLAVSLIVSRIKNGKSDTPRKLTLWRIFAGLGILLCFAGMFVGIATHRSWLAIASIATLGGSAALASVILVIYVFASVARSGKTQSGQQLPDIFDELSPDEQEDAEPTEEEAGQEQENVEQVEDEKEQENTEPESVAPHPAPPDNQAQKRAAPKKPRRLQ